MEEENGFFRNLKRLIDKTCEGNLLYACLRCKYKKHATFWLRVFSWRSRRDLNPRYPFGVHTISSRARYDHFDTAPCSRFSRLAYNTSWVGFCQPLF